MRTSRTARFPFQIFSFTLIGAGVAAAGLVRYVQYSHQLAFTALMIFAILLVTLLLGWLLILRTLDKWESTVLNSSSQLSQKTLENMVLQSEKMSAVGQLAAGVAHELNNPLGIILGFAQSLAKAIKRDDPLAPSIKVIERESLRCQSLVKELLNFSRHGKTEEQSVFELGDALSSALLLIEPQARVKSVEIKRKTCGDRLHVCGQKDQIEQVLINLSTNAMDAMPKGGVLTINTEVTQKDGRPCAQIEVEDTGAGIPKDIQAKIFEPFFTTKEPGQGTGLGLSLVREIIQKHKGTIECRSRESEGAIFTILLPATSNGNGNKSSREEDTRL